MRRLFLLFMAFAGIAAAQCGANGTFIGTSRTGDILCTGKVGAAGYSAPFSTATGLTVTAATHGQGIKPVGFCYDNSTPANLIAQTAGFPTVAANGDMVFAWTGSKTGYCVISALGNQVGPTGSTGPAGPAPACTGLVTSNGSAASCVGAPSGTVVGTSDTQTLTNKTVDGVSPTTMGYVDPTSSVQTQLNTKAPIASPTFTGTVTLPITGANQCLHVSAAGIVSGTGGDCGTGTGGVVGPGSSTNGFIPQWSGTSGTSLQTGLNTTGSSGDVMLSGGPHVVNPYCANEPCNLAYQYTGDSTTITSSLAKASGTFGVTLLSTTDTDGAVGVCVTGCGVSGSQGLASAGTVSCNFDGSTTIGHWVQISPSTAGDCHDSGSNVRPTSGQVIGLVLQAVGSGPAFISLQISGSSSSSSGSLYSGYNAYTGSSALALGTYALEQVTASAANPTVTVGSNPPAVGLIVHLNFCNDTSQRTWTLPSNFKLIGTPQFPSECVATDANWDGTNFNGPGTNTTPSIMEFSSTRSAPTQAQCPAGGCLWPDSTAGNVHFFLPGGGSTPYGMFLGGVDANPDSGQVTNGSHITNASIPNSGLASSATTVNGATCTLGANCSPYGGAVVYSSAHNIGAADIGKLVVMNCSSACAVTFSATPASTDWFGVESIGSTLATVSLNGKSFNGSAGAPPLNSFRDLRVNSDGTNYFGDAPLVAGTNMTFTPASNGFTLTASSTASTAFNSLTNGTNTAAAMVVGTGASMATSGSGTINATKVVDTNQNSAVTVNTTASAVDNVQVTNAATANPATVTISAVGSDSNINLNLVSKGTGAVQCNGSSCGGSGGSPGGSSTQLQYNNGGSAFGGTSEFTYASSTITASSSGTLDMSSGTFKYGPCALTTSLTDVLSSASGSETTFATGQCGMSGTATASTLDGTHPALMFRAVYNLAGNNNSVLTLRLRICRTSLFSGGTCSGNAPVLWINSVGNVNTSNNTVRSGAIVMVAASGTAGTWIVSRIAQANVIGAVVGSSDSAIVDCTGGVSVCTGGAVTFYWTATWGTVSSGTATCGSSASSGANCIGQLLSSYRWEN